MLLNLWVSVQMEQTNPWWSLALGQFSFPNTKGKVWHMVPVQASLPVCKLHASLPSSRCFQSRVRQISISAFFEGSCRRHITAIMPFTFQLHPQMSNNYQLPLILNRRERNVILSLLFTFHNITNNLSYWRGRGRKSINYWYLGTDGFSCTRAVKCKRSPWVRMRGLDGQTYIR